MAWMFIDCATVLCIYTVPVYMTGGEIARDSPIHISSVVAASSAARMNFTAATRAREVLTSRWPRWCTVRSDSTCGGRRISLKPGTSSIGRTLIRQCLRGTRQVSRRKNKGVPGTQRTHRRRPECAAAGFVNRCRGGALVPVRWGWWWQPLTRPERTSESGLPAVFLWKISSIYHLGFLFM